MLVVLSVGLLASACDRTEASRTDRSGASPTGRMEVSQGDRTPGPTTEPSDPFAQVHGWIAYGSRSDVDVAAVNPANPEDTASLGLSRRAGPIDWSPDGSLLLVQADGPECPEADTLGGLYVVDSNGSEAQLSRACSYSGSFSPDGTKVVFDDGESIYVADIDGGNRHLLAAGDCDAGWPSDPEWSPDGSEIAFTAYKECPGTRSIDVVSADGTDRHEIASFGNVFVGAPAWSPDGSRIAFSKTRGIFVVMADGSGPRRIADGGGDVAWSPDGSRIAFVRPRSMMYAHGGSWNYGLFTVAADGTDVQTIRRDRTDVAVFDDAMFLVKIAWNPVREGR
jgi:Tol biopolymer transport system component